MDIKNLQAWSRKLRVLYVEDENEIREETAMFLSRLIDTLTVASNGQEGFDSFQKGAFDLVITDLKMPILGGETMVRKIKTLDPKVVVVTMSGVSGNNGEANLPSDFFIRKPASMEDFVDVLIKIKTMGMIEKDET